MNNDLCLVPGAIDQYVPRATFDLLYPGQTPALTIPAQEAFPKAKTIAALPFSKENFDTYSDAMASVHGKSAFKHGGSEWLVTKVTVNVNDECEIFGVPYPHGIYDWAAE